jgi:DNA-binding response OmpR family regulator
MDNSVPQIKSEVDILIVEDSPTQTEQLKYLLEKNSYSVVVAENGLQALAVLEKYIPGIIISDIYMPDMDGYELCYRVKTQNRKVKIPVILITSLSYPEDVIKVLECGADIFITKPYDEDYLLSNVRQIIANHKLYQAERVRIGVEIMFGGKRRVVMANKQQLFTLLISTFEAAVFRNKELLEIQEELQNLKDKQAEVS